MPTRVRRVQRRAASRPGGTWARLQETTTTTVALSSKSLLATFTLSNAGIGETIRRTRGRIYVGSDQQAAGEVWTGAFGMIRVSDLAISTGSAAIPGPVTDANDDGWFVWEGFGSRFRFVDATGFQEAAGLVIDFDSKAMRRVGEGFGVAIMCENASSAAGLTILASVSMYSTRN